MVSQHHQRPSICILFSTEGMHGNGHDVTVTIRSWCCYDVTVAATVASEQIAIYPAAEGAIVAEGLATRSRPIGNTHKKW